MQYTGKLKIKSMKKIIEILNFEHVGRIASIDTNGYPQIIPMNFVFISDKIYMHSHIKGEKLENIKKNPNVGFEVDRELEYLPSYFEDIHDASYADTLYFSIIVKGISNIVHDIDEKVLALNGLMKKYQPEGKHDKIRKNDDVIKSVAIIKITPISITGKYKIGQQLSTTKRLALAQKIFLHKSATSKKTLKIMGFKIINNKLMMINEPIW